MTMIDEPTIDLAQNVRLVVDEPEWHWRSDGGTARGRIVPFMQPATVIDRGERFREQFMPNCLERMVAAYRSRGNASFISLNFDHDESIAGRIGHAVTIEALPDGGWCDFRLLPQRDLDKVRSMLNESHTGLSVMFSDMARPRLIDGVRSRVQIHVSHVAATPWPVYDGAMLTSVRSADAVPAPLTDVELADRPALAEWQAYLAELRPTR